MLNTKAKRATTTMTNPRDIKEAVAMLNGGDQEEQKAGALFIVASAIQCAPTPAKDFGWNPAHAVGTCSRCGEEMTWNVPRLGPDGGFIHKETGKLQCADQPDEGQIATFIGEGGLDPEA